MKLDILTERRIAKFINDHRTKTGELPTLQDFERQGISEEILKAAVKAGLIEKRYITLTNGAIMKSYVLS